MRPAIRVGRRGHVHVVRLPGPSGMVELVGTDVHHPARVAVVRTVEHNDVAPVCRRPGHPEGQLVGLAPGAHEEAHFQRIGHRAREPPGVLDDIVVQVAGVGVEGRDLPLRRLDNARVAVPHVAHVVHAIEVGPTVIVEQELAFSSHDLERLPVRHAQGAAEVATPQFEDLFRLHPWLASGEVSPSIGRTLAHRRPRRSRPNGQAGSWTSSRQVARRGLGHRQVFVVRVQPPSGTTTSSH